MLQSLARYYQTNKARIHRLSAEGGWIVAGQIASVIGALALVRVLTEYLDPTQYGELALGLTVAGLVNQVVMGGIINGISRFYSIAAEKQDLGGYLHATRYLLTYATAGVVAIGLIAMASLYWLGYSQWIGLAVAALVFSVLSGYNSALSCIQNAARQRAIVAFHGGLDAWLKILLTVGVVLWLGTSSTVVVIGYACSSLLITASQLVFLHRTIPDQHAAIPNRQQWMPQIWAYSLPFSIWGIFTWMHQISDRWALQAFASTSEVGGYAVLFQLGFTPIALATGMASNFLLPILYQRAGDSTDPDRNANVHNLSWKIAQFSLAITFAVFAMLLAVHEQLFKLLVASTYWAKSYLLPWILLAGGLFSSAQMLASKLLSDRNLEGLKLAKIITSIIGVLFYLIGAKLAGLNGVVIALVAYSMLHMLWIAVLCGHGKQAENKRLFI